MRSTALAPFARFLLVLPTIFALLAIVGAVLDARARKAGKVRRS